MRRFETVYNQRGQLTENVIALMVVVVLVSAVTTEMLGLHLLFGSFLAGAIMPKDKKFVRYILDKFETPTVVVLLPLYFAFTGLRTSIRLIKGPEMWSFCAVIILVAIAGKLGGSMIAARSAGSRWRESAGLGILMNTRGLMELVILNIGLDIGVISPALFSMMVLMALVTTSHDHAVVGGRVSDALDSKGGHRTGSGGGDCLRARVRASPACEGPLVIGAVSTGRFCSQ